MKAAEDAGVDLNLNASQGFATQAQQVSNVNNELSRGIDGLLINPVDVNGAVGAVEDGVAKGVPVVSIGTLETQRRLIAWFRTIIPRASLRRSSSQGSCPMAVKAL